MRYRAFHGINSIHIISFHPPKITHQRKCTSQDQPCAICKDPDVYDNNEIIFCDKCDVAVHQTCYGVTTVPDGPW